MICCGIGYINRNSGWKLILSRSGGSLSDAAAFEALGRGGIFSYPFKNFARLDAASKMVCYAVALALKDAGESYAAETKRDIALIGTNAEGSLSSDITYFNDYLDGGRKLSRGNLFLYTLPSSPLGEAAIHFGLQGPLYYTMSAESSVADMFESASDLLLEEAPAVLAVANNENEAACFMFKGDGSREGTVASEDSAMIAAIREKVDLMDIAETFLLINEDGRTVK